jgi:hypothetical protein
MKRILLIASLTLALGAFAWADQLPDVRSPEQQRQDAMEEAEETARGAAIQWLEDHPKISYKTLIAHEAEIEGDGFRQAIRQGLVGDIAAEYARFRTKCIIQFSRPQ